MIAEAGQLLVPGHVHVAPPDRHLTVDRNLRIQLEDSPLVSVQRPSGTVLFTSMARALGHRCVGVLLTGMGEDGARGLLDLHNGGAFTIAEAESTAAPFSAVIVISTFL